MRNTLTFLILSFLISCVAKQQSPIDSITPQSIHAEVEWLASDNMKGRYYRSKEGRLAAKYIAHKWISAGLSPLPNKTSMYLPTDDMRDSPNVAGMLQGTGDEYVLITAHYDHLAPKRNGKDTIYNGADDNASGTAALIEIAKVLGNQQQRYRASIVLVAFTGEEAGLVGSEHFVKSAPIPIHKIKALINLDMISRGDPNTIFLEGAPDAPRIALALSNANKQIGLNIIRDKHPDWLYRSDQLPFLEQEVPAVFLSVEDHEDYHRVTDHTDKIIPELAAKTTKLTLLAALELAHPVP
jgi:Zn-dependent M28 family amino/carboxypeptidase